MTYSDRTLQKFLSGLLPDDQAREIETTMLADPALERRIMALDSVAEPVRNAMRHIPNPADLEAMSRSLDRPAPRNRNSMAWGGVAAALITGLVVGWQFLPSSLDATDNWRLEVARYQALYVPETLDQIAVDADALQTQFQRASDELDLALDPNRLAQTDGVTLTRAQILGFQGAPLIQIAYRDASGQPIALCIVKKSGAASDPTGLKMVGMASSSWNSATHQFILIGGQDQTQIDNLAAQLKPLI